MNSREDLCILLEEEGLSCRAKGTTSGNRCEVAKVSRASDHIPLRKGKSCPRQRSNRS
jgi:hypothetical protein